MYRPALIAGVLFALVAVILGAFGAHVLRRLLTADQFYVFSTAVRYHIYHCFALLSTGILYRFFPYKVLKLATVFFIIGITLFCGSLYLMNLLSLIHMSIGLVGILTPIGGLFFISGWFCMLLAVLKNEVA